MADELKPPPDVFSDPDSFELLRLWAAHGRQHVSIRPNFDSGPYAFGQMLAHLAQHGARMHAQHDGTEANPQLRAIIRGLLEELEESNDDMTGSIPGDA